MTRDYGTMKQSRVSILAAKIQKLHKKTCHVRKLL